LNGSTVAPEESAPSPDRLERRRVWVVDPIDGTSAFLKGEEEFTVSAALLEDGAPLLAALAAPAIGEIYCAERGGGATLDGTEISPIERQQTLEGATLLGQQALIDELSPAKAGPFSGSIVHQMCMSALGRVDGTVSKTPMMEWDICGAHLFAQELGLTVTDASGSSITYNKPIPDTPGLICGAASLVSEILERFHADS